MMKAPRFLVLFFLLVAPSSLAGQTEREGLLVTPYLGVHFDNAFRSGTGFSREGLLAGVRATHPLGPRLGLVADAGWAEVNDVGTLGVGPDVFVYGVDQAHLTLGVDRALVSGPTEVLLGLQAGAAWRSEEVEGTRGDPLPQWDETGGWTAHPVAVPSLTIRRAVGRRLGVELRVQDQLMLADADVGHSPGLSMGVAVR